LDIVSTLSGSAFSNMLPPKILLISDDAEPEEYELEPAVAKQIISSD
jgi:hypothetical protein